ncbi:PRC-barrel domain-containing protein [Sulfuriferula sp.]|uniref:PRC-barrel domain-containing protein n=1 Tax=Sulfuriferula sp. TaxID=2025307 RepID=UPI002731C2D7|nr:PRC-barrel domain-containing protein [Sulfuriferula sp.]MDP2024622.1 PRC-barrel domain-containing protein [Sulfuriferula sp.]
MKTNLIAAVMTGTVLSLSGMAYAAPMAGYETVGVSVADTQVAAMGWSAEKQILHKAVYNDDHKKIGVIEDIIISPEKSLSYAVVGVGGFLGMDRHDVLIPFNHFRSEGSKYLLPGATKPMLKSLPEFKYNKK